MMRNRTNLSLVYGKNLSRREKASGPTHFLNYSYIYNPFKLMTYIREKNPKFKSENYEQGEKIFF